MEVVYDIEAIMKFLPHRYPFILIDRIIKLVAGKELAALKNVTINEAYFQGHFPGYPIFPGVLIIEALAQVGAVAVLSLPQHKGKSILFAGVDNLRFRGPVFPGDSLRLEVKLTKMRSSIGKGTAIATVEGKTVAEGELTFAIANPEQASARVQE